MNAPFVGQNIVVGGAQNPPVVHAPQPPQPQPVAGAGAVHTANVHHIQDVNEFFDGVPEARYVDAVFAGFGGR